MKKDLVEDEELLASLLKTATRREAFSLLLAKYQPKVYYFLRNLNLGHEEADEEIQEIFIQFWRSLAQLQKTDSLPVLLYRLVADRCLKRWDKNPDSEANVSPEASRGFTDGRGQPAMQLALSKLSGSQKIIFMLKQQEQFSYSDIALITRRSIPDVRKDFSKALEIFSYSVQQT